MYGLSLAKGLIESQVASCVLLLTSDTYSKYIHPLDKSVRTLFGDAMERTAIFAREATEDALGPFVFGTDGAGAKNLIVEAGLYRMPKSCYTSVEQTDDYGNVSRNNLHERGEVMAFSLKEASKVADALLKKVGQTKDDIDFFVLHQANKFMLEALRKKLKLDEDKLPIIKKDMETQSLLQSQSQCILLRAKASYGTVRSAVVLVLDIHGRHVC